MIKKSIQEIDMLRMFLKNKEPMTRKKAIDAPLLRDRKSKSLLFPRAGDRNYRLVHS